ncbi:MAG: OB-fold-containig protein [Pseudomonadota bacterium]
MFDLYLTGPFVPFTVALALLFALLFVELLMIAFGATMLGGEADAELDVDVDISAPDLDALDVDLDGVDPEMLDLGEPEVDVATTPSASPASWLGIGKMPFLIWVAVVLLGFGATGYALQSTLAGLIGLTLPAIVAAVPAGVVAVWFAKTFGAAFARILPKTETEALSARHLGRRLGTVSQGIARRGSPAEVKVTDRFGNTHYLRGEPLKDCEEITAGTEVLVLRHKREEGYRLVPIGPSS